MMKCKYCGGNLTLEQAYCPHCGKPNEEAMQHVKDMENYKSHFEDTKSDIYEVAQKNTEIMSRTVIITVLTILCALVFLIYANSYAIYRAVRDFDAKIHYQSYSEQIGTYLDEEDYLGLNAFCAKHGIRAYSDKYGDDYGIVINYATTYAGIYDAVMRAVTMEDAKYVERELNDIVEYYNNMTDFLKEPDEYRYEQYEELDAARQQDLLQIIDTTEVLIRAYFGLTPEELESFRGMTNARRIVLLEEKSEVMGYGQSVE